MLIPLRHENMRGRRWPIITFVLICVNIVVFLLTRGPIQDQQLKRTEVRLHLLMLAAAHPELHMSDDASAFVESIKKRGHTVGPTRLQKQFAARPLERTFQPATGSRGIAGTNGFALR